MSMPPEKMRGAGAPRTESGPYGQKVSIHTLQQGVGKL